MNAQSSHPPRTVRHPPPDRPLLIYDGECNFCGRWIARWEQVTGKRVGYCEFQQLGERFPEIPRAAFEQAVQLIELDGRVLSGADAVIRLFDFAPQKRWLPRLMRGLPGFMPIARVAYRFIAAHRTFFSRITAWNGDPHNSTQPPP